MCPAPERERGPRPPAHGGVGSSSRADSWEVTTGQLAASAMARTGRRGPRRSREAPQRRRGHHAQAAGRPRSAGKGTESQRGVCSHHLPAQGRPWEPAPQSASRNGGTAVRPGGREAPNPCRTEITYYLHFEKASNRRLSLLRSFSGQRAPGRRSAAAASALRRGAPAQRPPFRAEAELPGQKGAPLRADGLPTAGRPLPWRRVPRGDSAHAGPARGRDCPQPSRGAHGWGPPVGNRVQTSPVGLGGGWDPSGAPHGTRRRGGAGSVGRSKAASPASDRRPTGYVENATVPAAGAEAAGGGLSQR